MNTITDFLLSNWLIILTALAGIGAIILFIKGHRDAFREPTKGYIRYDTDYDKQTQYDEKYLQHCIDKATPNLSKIKDVDKELAEIRGDYETEEHTLLIEDIDKLMYKQALKNKLKDIEADKNHSLHPNRRINLVTSNMNTAMDKTEMNVLIGFEESQTVCKAFRELGHEAYSNDLKDASGGYPQWHLKMDFFKALYLKSWDLIILHPPCTYTAICGNRWYWNSEKREEGIILCRDAWNKSTEVCNKVALEQPKTIMQRYIGKKSQVIQPWQFGHGETKETWLWLKNLPLLKPTNIVEGREHRIWKMTPGPDRQRLRSITYQGIADAFAMQWGNI